MAKIVLDGFDPQTEQDLTGVLAGQGHEVAIGWAEAGIAADALFCSTDSPGYPMLVRAVRRERPELPVIVVTAGAEQSTWLDAMEAGAADYCCAPFETLQLTRLLAGVLPPKPKRVSRV